MIKVRSPWIFIWITLVIFIFYGTLIPFDLNFTFANHMPVFFQGLRGRLRPSLPDAASNVLLYALYGFLFCYAIRTRSKLVHFISCLILGISISLFTEWLQAYSTSRISSRIDVYMNALGLILGYLSASLDRSYINPFLKNMIWGDARKNPWVILAIFWSLCIIIASLAPFYVTLDVSYVYGGVKRLLAKSPLVLLHQRDYWLGAIDITIRFVVLGYLVSHINSNVKTGLHIKCIYLLIIAIIFPCFIEFSQLFIHYRVADFIDILISILSFFLGFFVLSRISSWRTLILIYILALLLCALSPFQFEPAKALNGSMLIPYDSYSHEIGLKPLEDFIEQGTLFIPLGLLLYAITRKIYYNKRESRQTMLLCFCLGWFISLMMEISQIWVYQRYPEITDTITGGLGCWLGAYIGLQYDKRVYM